MQNHALRGSLPYNSRISGYLSSIALRRTACGWKVDGVIREGAYLRRRGKDELGPLRGSLGRIMDSRSNLLFIHAIYGHALSLPDIPLQ
jgi:hypothetical protein